LTFFKFYGIIIIEGERKEMTVQELYDWARQHGALDIDIEVDYAEGAPNYLITALDLRIKEDSFPIQPKFIIYLP
jgi:hypothetical protein